jgi:ankyrin repeat protein
LDNTSQDDRIALLSQGDPKSIVSVCLLSSQHLLNVDDSKGDTGLHKAAYYGHTAVVSYLIEMGAEMDVRNNVCGLFEFSDVDVRLVGFNQVHRAFQLSAQTGLN